MTPAEFEDILSKLQRYDCDTEYGCECCTGDRGVMTPSDNGDYIRFDAIVRALHKVQTVRA